MQADLVVLCTITRTLTLTNVLTAALTQDQEVGWVELRVKFTLTRRVVKSGLIKPRIKLRVVRRRVCKLKVMPGEVRGLWLRAEPCDLLSKVQESLCRVFWITELNLEHRLR